MHCHFCTRVHLPANLARPHEVAGVQFHRTDGAGLFRTEFLFLESQQPPAKSAQIEAYTEVASALSGLDVRIRTLDLGPDKKPRFLAPRFEIEKIIDRVDFLSLGRNDLTQFMLAADRNATHLLTEEALLQPSLLRAIKMVVDAATEKDCPVCVCGEAAGDPMLACLLAGLGLRRLSMAPSRAARVRSILRRSRLSDLEDPAERALGNGSARKNTVLLQGFRRSSAYPGQVAFGR